MVRIWEIGVVRVGRQELITVWGRVGVRGVQNRELSGSGGWLMGTNRVGVYPPR